jgi:hypothetical protein
MPSVSMIMAVLMRLVVMRVTMIMFVTVLVVVLMFHRVQIPLVLECPHAPRTRAHKTVTMIVATPPTTMAGTNPNQAAVVPDSNSLPAHSMHQ